MSVYKHFAFAEYSKRQTLRSVGSGQRQRYGRRYPVCNGRGSEQRYIVPCGRLYRQPRAVQHHPTRVRLTDDKVGFTDYLPATRQITPSTLGDDTLTFYLMPGGKELGEVAVYGYRQFVKLMPSGFSYDIGKDLRSKSEDLLTAMRRVPMVVVDGEGKITVKGKTNFSIYLNGKPFNMANADPTQVLQSIPAANIAKIEMITTTLYVHRATCFHCRLSVG